MGQPNIKKHFKFHNFSEIFYCGMIRFRNEFEYFYAMSVHKNHFKKKKILDRVYLRNTENVKFRWNSHFTVEYANLDVFIQCQYTKTILRNKNIGQSLLKKHSKFQKFDEILYCGMTRFRNFKLDVFRQYQNTKTILKKKKIWAESF